MIRPRSPQRAARVWLLTAATLVIGLMGCGGGSSSPTTPASPPPPPGELHSVVVVLYYDVNRNNVLDPEETVRLFDVELQIGGGTGRTQVGSGRAVVQGVPAGSHQVVMEPSSLPPFFVAGAPVTIQVPRAEDVLVPAVLPIGQNRPFNYLSTGDSISKGEGSDDEMGYRSILLSRLREYYEVPVRMFYRGRGRGPSADGAGRTPRDLSLIQPAYTLIGWGNNDWNECGAPSTCDTVANLRSIVLDVKAANSLPCVATLLPPNVGYDNRAPASRAEWVVEMNGLIRAMALQEGALVVDIHAAFMSAGSLSGLFVDHIHPNPRGYELMAEIWFNALTRPRSFTVGADYSRAAALPLLHGSGRDPLQRLARGFSQPIWLSATGT